MLLAHSYLCLRHAFPPFGVSLESAICIKPVFSIKPDRNLPFLTNVKRPFELQVSLLVVINKCAGSCVVSTSQHSRWRILLGDYHSVSKTPACEMVISELTFLDIHRCLISVWSIRTLSHNQQVCPQPCGQPQPTIISWSLLTLIPFLFTICT